MGLDKRAIGTFLAFTFGLTWLVEAGLIAMGFRVNGGTAPLYGQLAVAAVMWIPALGAWISLRFIRHEPLKRAAMIRIGPLRPYLEAALLIPLCFAGIYGLTWLLGLGRPDWQLNQLREMVVTAGGEFPTTINPGLVLTGLFAATLVTTPFLNGIFGFGEELGWRGFLLPRLLPLGKTRAYLLLGAIWGLWHAPLILVGFNYPGYPLLGILGMMGLTTALGYYVNDLTLRYQSSVLAGWVHGVINSQGYGVWRILFPDVNPLIGGISGLVGIFLFGLLGYWQSKRPQPSPRPHTITVDDSAHPLPTP